VPLPPPPVIETAAQRLSRLQQERKHALQRAAELKKQIKVQQKKASRIKKAARQLSISDLLGILAEMP